MLDRTNYEKLVSLFSKNDTLKVEKNGGLYDVSGIEYILTRRLWVNRIQKKDEKRKGLDIPCIDVFVLDHCPDRKIVQGLKVLSIKVLQGMMHDKLNFRKDSVGMNICLIMTYLFGRLFPNSIKYKMYNKISSIGNKEKTEFISCYNDIFSQIGVKYPETMMNIIERHLFEDTLLPIPAKYDSYLTTLFGDYMILPKESDRKPSHISSV